MYKIKSTILIFLVITIFVITNSCKDDPVYPIEEEDIVPQTDIEWPSLANSPWPMHHHDPQSTGRSKYIGPSKGKLFSKISAIMQFGISIGFDVKFYVPTITPYNISAYDYEGNLKWEHENIIIYSTPTISRDSSILITSGTKFIALNNDGKIKWDYNLDEGTINLSAVLDKEGNIYFLSGEHTLNVLDKDGNLLWELTDDKIGSGLLATPTFSHEGNVLYLQGTGVSIVAIDIKTKNILWTFGENYLCTSPIIDSDGNLIIIYTAGCWNTSEAIVYSLNSNGQINWMYPLNNFHMPSNIEPTIDYNGNIYLGADTLYSFSNRGKTKVEAEIGR